MRRNWIAVSVLILLALTAAALVKEQFNFEVTAGEETASRPVNLNETPNNSYGLSPGIEEEERIGQYSAASVQKGYLSEFFITEATQLPAGPSAEGSLQEGIEAETAALCCRNSRRTNIFIDRSRCFRLYRCLFNLLG
jgi:hypothetical protein